MSGRVRITVSDREDDTIVHLPEDYFGQVELSFRAGVLVNSRKSETVSKATLKGKTQTDTDEQGRTPTG